MAYEKHTWVDNEDITKERLNAMESGIEEAAQSGGALIVQWDHTTGRLNKTVQDIYDAYNGGAPVYVSWIYGTPSDSYLAQQSLSPVTFLYAYNYGSYFRIVITSPRASSPTTGSGKFDLFAPSAVIFSAESLSDYPTYYTTVSISNSALTYDSDD